MFYSTWPSKLDEALTRFFLNGLSFAKIAARLSADFGMEYSRNACIGRAHRLGLSQSQRPQHKPVAKRSKAPPPVRPHKEKDGMTHAPIPAPPRFACDPATGLHVADVVPLHLSLLELGPGQCRWPYGDKDFLFCGQPSLEESSYCFEHFRLSLRSAA